MSDNTESLTDVYGNPEESQELHFGLAATAATLFVSGLVVFSSSLSQHTIETQPFIGGATAPAQTEIGSQLAAESALLTQPLLVSIVGMSLMLIGIVSMYVIENPKQLFK